MLTDELESGYNCQKDEGTGRQPTDITFSKTLENDDYFSVTIKIEPSSTGTFILNPQGDGMKVMQGDIVIDFNDLEGPNLMALPDNGTNGSITITRYPAVGGNITGTFKGRLKDGSDKKTGFYDVSGEFKVKRTQ